MAKYNIKKIIAMLLVMILALQSITFAKKNNPYEGEVDEPVAETKSNISEGIIISTSPYEEYNPINPVRPGVIKEEYDAVDNYVIDLKTLESRIKYFSPTYNNIRSGAESMYWVSFYARGGNDTLMYDAKSYTEEIDDLANLYKSTMNNYISERNKLDTNDANYASKYRELTTQIVTYRTMYNVALATYRGTNQTIGNTKEMLGLNNILYNIGNLDNNTQIAFARRSVTKAITSVVLTYLQLDTYTKILEKQTDLYYDMYKLNSKNYGLGLATAIDVSTSLDTYENAKNTFKTTASTLNNVKEQIAINLGYSLSDVDKLVFVEPEVDFDYIESINLEDDKEKSCTSNSAYQSIKMSDRDKRLPQSTGEELFHKRIDYTSNLITAELENIYDNLQAKKLSYEASLYLKQICDINDEANLRKFQNNLVSELEFKGLELQNLGNKLQVSVAKYDLISASLDYYYATLGDISLS